MYFRQISVFFMALSVSACVVSVDDWKGEEQYVDLQKAEPFQQEKAFDVRLELKSGEMEIGPGLSDDLYELDLHYNEAAVEPEIEFEREGENARMRFELGGHGKFLAGFGDTRLRLLLNQKVATQLGVRSGVGETMMDLSGISLRSLELESGVGETTISKLQPNSILCDQLKLTSGVGEVEVIGLGNFRFQRFDFKGGVGSSKLDFSGEWEEPGRVEIEVGVGGIEINLPRSLGAEIRFTKSFLSGSEMPGFTQKGDTYYSDNLERAEKVIRIRIRSGIGGVEVKWI